MAATVICEAPFRSTSRLPPQETSFFTRLTPPPSKETFKDIKVIKSLNKAKFPVYLISTKVNQQIFAMKVFSYKNGKIHPYFNNEVRFKIAQHPHVVRMVHSEHEKEITSKSSSTKVSYIIMEYAPHGDFFDFVMNHAKQIDEKLVRTYFRQLIEGLEYLHKYKICHMDLKLENLLIGENFNLKIADFDLSYIDNDPKILSKGTKFYRAPELWKGTCKNPKIADIYSAGIVLFTLKSRGILAHSENNLINGNNFSELLYYNENLFWKKHCEVQKKDESFFDEGFKELFIAMTKLNPAERISIEGIKRSKWYNGPFYTSEELKMKIKKILN